MIGEKIVLVKLITFFLSKFPSYKFQFHAGERKKKNFERKMKPIKPVFTNLNYVIEQNVFIRQLYHFLFTQRTYTDGQRLSLLQPFQYEAQ